MENSEHRSFFRVSKLDMNFGSMEALKNVSFGVERGMIFGIAGPNGAGKTTLLNIISGALNPTRGEVYLDGENIASLKPMRVCHKGIARTFQIPTVFPTLSVLDNVRVGKTFGHAPGRKGSKDLSEIIDFVGLRGKEQQLAANVDLYSRKLVMLAAALATEPQIFLLDEPLGGLNLREIEAYLKLIKELNQGMGVTLLVVEHLFDKLVEISEKIMILDFGQQIYLGPSDKVGEDKKVIEVYLGMKRHAGST
jgi:branched-chain amino acid transport system ATP-binding protein